jgi:hypothetical protein
LPKKWGCSANPPVAQIIQSFVIVLQHIDGHVHVMIVFRAATPDEANAQAAMLKAALDEEECFIDAIMAIVHRHTLPLPDHRREPITS